MKTFLIVTDKADAFSGLVSGLHSQAEAEIRYADSVKAVLDTVAQSPPDLIIIDEKTEGLSGLEIAGMIIRKNAMINMALVSSMSPEEFHEASEGLGILAQIRPRPDSGEAGILLEALAKMM
ncbi:MAG: response regulator [Desulfococcaceae bacterium]